LAWEVFVARQWAVVLWLGAMSSPALGLEVLDSVLQGSYTHEGVSRVSEDHVVPLLPNNACYTWYIRVVETGTPITIVERMTLPQSIDWTPVTSDPQSPTKVDQSGRIATTTLPITTDSEGWFWHGWCVAPGDPLGQHSIEVSVEDQSLAAFHFAVVAPEEFAFPVRPLTSTDRTANNNW
jgi:hypothetical protein